jgi:hypothetical protein
MHFNITLYLHDCPFVLIRILTLFLNDFTHFLSEIYEHIFQFLLGHISILAAFSITISIISIGTPGVWHPHLIVRPDLEPALIPTYNVHVSTSDTTAASIEVTENNNMKYGRGET